MTTFTKAQRENIEAAIRALRYGAHPHRSPHADDLEAMLAEPAPLQLPKPVLQALRFYAQSEHYHFGDDVATKFNTVSGEPQNWLCHEDVSTMIENGMVARFALRGEPISWIDDGDDCTPDPLEGEIFSEAEA